ncbi:MAG TPA: hypothetical protein QGI07_01180 [Dehalococcoidia bacterium]|nr:hypothetical protein [Dehalococcoidia bacterium]MDP6274148.1 hypothetical protein [Dehalococcoidia bacterium]MDP7161644.1 hypothetical protein [Dehalococcoidia bacterium]MDP7212070.1 hypothetical protein [Dehalococcoidia bacterium]MDP7515105.1 hypothetical protein [Dehalococcoidia bacterium]
MKPGHVADDQLHVFQYNVCLIVGSVAGQVLQQQNEIARLAIGLRVIAFGNRHAEIGR